MPPLPSSLSSPRFYSAHQRKRLSAREFIQSRRIASAIVLLQQEDKSTRHAAAGHPSIVSASACNDDGHEHPVENATRLALALTQSFVDFISGPGNENESSSIIPLTLDDFFVNFKQESYHVNASPRHSDSDRVMIITLREVDVVISRATEAEDPQHDQQQQYTKTAQIQILGKILYSIFCPGKSSSPTSDTTTFTVAASSRTDGEDQDDSNERSTKASRVTKETLFTRLSESTTLPKSICRFLFDMIEIGPNGESDSPFTSFEDVIRDLEQMMVQPEIFLHDDDSQSSLSLEAKSPLFGHKHYGRKEEVATLMKLADDITKQPLHSKEGVQAAFVSGIAGSGKTCLVQAVEENLSSFGGWIVIKAKFERSTKHASRGILSSMFDEIVRHLVNLKGSGIPDDIAYSQRASKSILDSIGCDTLSVLVDFLPSIPLLFDGIDKVERTTDEQAKIVDWQLVQSLTNILEAVLESIRFIMICCDDLQWADKTTLSLINEILFNVGDDKHISRRVLFVGLYRSNEIDDDHPFSMTQFSLQTSSSVNLTEIELSCLSKDDVIGMLMTKLELPQRLVMELADVVYKKTAGHAFFVVELLNSLLRDSIVKYSSDKCRYTWEDDRISFIETGDSVAELIASNLKSLAPKLQQILQILSCFGIQTDDSLLQILEGFQKGIVCSIDTFIEQGVLDRAGPIVIFTHDLIQQTVYESMSLDEQKSLHLRIGEFIGALAAALTPKSSQTIGPVTAGFGQLCLTDQVFYSGRNISSTLMSIACDQVNAAESDPIMDRCLKVKYAGWNLSAANGFAIHSNFSAALHYHSNGISYLDTECWRTDAQLCLELHKGAVFSSFNLGEADKVHQYAQEVIVHVPFEDSIGVEQFVLKALTQSGQHKESASRGIDLMRRLNFNIPLDPSEEFIANAIASTTDMASQYSSDCILSLCRGTTHDSMYAALRIFDAFFISACIAAFHLVPLIVCEVVKFSLQNDVCPESVVAFANFAFLKILLYEDFSGGKYWSDITRNIIKCLPEKNKNSGFCAELVLLIRVDIFFMSPRDIALNLMDLHHDAMKHGSVDVAITCVLNAWRFRLLGGYNLSIILQCFEDLKKLIVKHSKFLIRFLTLDATLLIELTGKRIDCFSVYGDSISCLDDLRSEAEASHNSPWLYIYHVNNMISAYWRGEYREAEEQFCAAGVYQLAPKTTLHTIHLTFFGGIVAFHLHRQEDSDDDQRLERGRQMMEKFEKWAENSDAVYENKLMLLKAEYLASVYSYKAQPLYEASIKSAQDHGNIHDLALAYELLGNYYCSTDAHGVDANDCFTKACVYYEQWGADAIAKRLIHKYDLKIDPRTRTELQLKKSKNPRN